VRKDLLWSENVAIKKALDERERPKAKERQDEGRKLGGKVRHGSLPANCRQAERAETRDVVAKALGVGARTLEKAEAVCEAAAEDPKRFGPIAEEMDRTGKVDRAVQRTPGGHAGPTHSSGGMFTPPGLASDRDISPPRGPDLGLDYSYACVSRAMGNM